MHESTPALSNREIAVFARPPIPGRCKTRLAMTIGSEAAAELSRAFATDTVRIAQHVSGATARFHVTEADSFFDEFSERSCLLSPILQSEGDLGRRMHSAFAKGAAAVVGTDAPTLPPSIIERAFELRQEFELVLTPASDGGYVFIASSHEASRCLLAPIRWSTPHTLVDTLAAASELQIPWALTPPHFDVDWQSDLDLVRLQLRENPGIAPETARALRRIGNLPNRVL